MPTGLKRDLGLLSTTAIAVGAMVGSGIFILPAIAYASAGPAAVVAFLIAGLLVLPAALSAAEMATAMPEDGGAYIYVERGMGPALGTVAGIGTWLMLSLKSALALVGGVPYLAEIAPILADWVVVMAVALALFFTLVNIVSSEGSGKMQFIIVGIMLGVMAFFIFGGFSSGEFQVDQTQGSFDLTAEGVLAAIGVVFVSYAGVTKVTAVAEEVKNPGRNLPIAMVGSLLFVTALYVAVVWVAIGVADLEPGAGFVPEGNEETAPIAAAADIAFGQVGVIAVVIAAIFALASTANAGLLAASRFPFAMARDGLVPDRLESVSQRYNTPANAIALTGAVLVVMVTIFPIQQIAQFGSAFQILVFILLNVALIGFREGAVEEYQPEFVAPLYPWLQLIGIGGGILVLTQMGLVPFGGALVIVFGSLAWYYLYARPRIDREGAATTGVRESVGASAAERTRSLFEQEREYDVLVAITEHTSPEARRDMLRIATDLGRLRTTAVSLVEFVDVPHHLFPNQSSRVSSGDTPEWIADDPDERPDWYPKSNQPKRTSGGTELLKEDTDDTVATDAHIEYRRISSEDHKEAIVDFATYEEIDLLLLERETGENINRLLGRSETEWLLQNAPCDVALVEDRGFEAIEEIAVTNRGEGPYDPLKLLIADAIAEETGAEINLIQAIPADAPPQRRESAEAYHQELISTLTVPARSTVLETNTPIEGIIRFVGQADLLLTGVSRGGLFDRVRGGTDNKLVDSVECTAVMVQTQEARRKGLLERLLMEYIF